MKDFSYKEQDENGDFIPPNTKEIHGRDLEPGEVFSLNGQLFKVLDKIDENYSPSEDWFKF